MRHFQITRYASRRAPAQALVEFVLASTLILFLLAAAVDLGLIFFTLQGLRTAAQEGATFGSYPVPVYKDAQNRDVYAPADPTGMTYNRVDLNYPEIINRIYSSGGLGASSSLANLRDLDNNEQDDMTQNLYQSYTGANDFIRIENLRSNTGPPAPGGTYSVCRGNVRGVELQAGGRNCYIRVTVSYNYRLFFPLAPALGSTVRLHATHLMPVRSSFYTN